MFAHLNRMIIIIAMMLIVGCKPSMTTTPVPATATTLLPTVTQIPLTNIPQPLLSPTYQPSPTPAQTSEGLIVFYSERDGDAEIFVMNSDGSDQRPLTDNNTDDFSPSWSPDGTLIVFESDRDDPHPQGVRGGQKTGVRIPLGAQTATHKGIEQDLLCRSWSH